VIDAAQMQEMMGQFNSAAGDMAKQWSVFKDALTELSNKEMDWMKNNEKMMTEMPDMSASK
jgi:hypothetical protein